MEGHERMIQVKEKKRCRKDEENSQREGERCAGRGNVQGGIEIKNERKAAVEEEDTEKSESYLL